MKVQVENHYTGYTAEGHRQIKNFINLCQGARQDVHFLVLLCNLIAVSLKKRLGADMEPSKDVLLDLHRRMVRIRHFEEEAGKLSESGKMPGALHLYVGEEAVAAGVMVHLTDDDQITSTHRGHGHVVAKGGDFKKMYAK